MTRQETLQQLACEAVRGIEPLATKHLKEIQDTMELAYYIKHVTTRLEIILNMRYGVEKD